MKKLTKYERAYIKNEVEKIRKNEKEQYEFLRNHEAPVTRRDFLGLGLLTGTGFVFSTPILDVFASKVYAADCNNSGGGGGGSSAGFIQLEGSGGGNWGSACIPTLPNGDLLSADGYIKFGYRAEASPIGNPDNIDTSLGFRIHPGSSLYNGIMQNVTEEMKQYLHGVFIASRCENDTSRNTTIMTQLIQAAQGPGQLTGIVGSNASANGARSRSSGGELTTSSQITSAADTANLVNLGPILERLGEDDARKILEAAQITSERKLAAWKKKDVSDQLKDLIKCGYGNAIESVFKNTAEALNPNNDQLMNINGMSDRDKAVVKTVLDGNATAGALVDGGYDYHNNQATGTRAGATKRGELGGRISNILAAAFAKQQDVSIFVTTDGSASCTAGGRDVPVGGLTTAAGTIANQREDASTSGHLFIHASFGSKRTRSYDPMKAHLGGYTAAGSIDLGASLVSNDPAAMTVAVLINHLAVQGQEVSVARIKSICSAAGVASPFDTQAKINAVKILG